MKTKKTVLSIPVGTLEKIKKEVKSKKAQGVYITQPMLMEQIIIDHFKTKNHD